MSQPIPDVNTPEEAMLPGGTSLLIRSCRPRMVPRYPIVFCHGMLGVSMLRLQFPKDPNYFSALREWLQELEVRALFPQVAPTGGVVERARQLRDQITAWTSEPVNLIAHSMGGLDARYAITHLGLADRVRSLTTVSTPHHGTAVADWFCDRFPQGRMLLFTLGLLGIDVKGFRDCRVKVCREFNQQTPDVPGVQYFSFGAAVSQSRVSPFLRRAWSILNAREGPNDGMVSMNSARWGTYLGTLAVEHFAQTPDGLVAQPGQSYDALGFITRIIDELGQRGF